MKKHHLSSRIYHLGSNKAFTLMELLVVISLLVIIAIIVLITLNPWGQINKGNDSKRKQELTQLNKTFEDFYNDKNCYPAPSEVCYNDTGGTTCNICGSESAPPDFANFSPYQNPLPCDPLQPTKKYLYQVDDVSCPSWYRIYTTLSNQSDPIIASVGCSTGCVPSPDFIYDYGVSSPNTGLESSLTACLTSGSCNNYCSSIGKTCVASAAFSTYSDDSCQTQLGICSGPTCCSQNPVGGQVQSYKCFCE